MKLEELDRAVEKGEISPIYYMYGDEPYLMERATNRLLDRLVDRLGGEPPFWKHSRKSRSNASAQAELRARGES